MAAMFLGYRVQDRLDQEIFRKVTLAVLILTGAQPVAPVLRRLISREARMQTEVHAVLRRRGKRVRTRTPCHCIETEWNNRVNAVAERQVGASSRRVDFATS